MTQREGGSGRDRERVCVGVCVSKCLWVFVSAHMCVGMCVYLELAPRRMCQTVMIHCFYVSLIESGVIRGGHQEPLEGQLPDPLNKINRLIFNPPLTHYASQRLSPQNFSPSYSGVTQDTLRHIKQYIM